MKPTKNQVHNEVRGDIRQPRKTLSVGNPMRKVYSSSREVVKTQVHHSVAPRMEPKVKIGRVRSKGKPLQIRKPKKS